MIEAPLAVSPDVVEALVGLIGRDLPPDTAIVNIRVYGPKQGNSYAADSELSVASIKMQGTDKLGMTGTDIKPAGAKLNMSGKLPMPKEGKALTFDAALVNSFGETMAWARATTTSRIQPIGILVPVSRASVTSALQALLEDLHLEHEDLLIDLGPNADFKDIAKKLQRWRVLLCDHPLSESEGENLQRVIREMPTKPVLLFVGSGSDGGELSPGWQMVMKTPLKPGPCRIVLVTADKSASMWQPCGSGTKKKYEMAADLARALADGLEKRRWNRLVLPVIGPHTNTQFPDGTEVTVDNYAVPNQQWELDHHLRELWRLVNEGQPISDAVLIFDPEDVRDPGINLDLSREALEAAENLHNKGVRLWLIAAGPNVNLDELVRRKPESKAIFAASIRTSLQAHANNPDQLVAYVKQLVLEEMFPRLQVEAANSGAGLTPSGFGNLQRYVHTQADYLRLLNGLVPFAPAGQQAAAAETSLFLRHWGASNLVAPLLVHGILDLGDGQTGNYAHLALDLTAERAKIPSGSSPVRNSLAGMIVRVVAALSDEMQQPGIYWLPNGTGGLEFYSADHRPFAFKRDPAFDRTTLKGVGIGLRTVAGFGVGLTDAQADARRLELPGLMPEHLDRENPSAVRFVVEDQRPEVGRLGLTLTLTAPPPLPLLGDSRSLGGADPAAADPADLSQQEWRIPGPLVRWLFAAFWGLLAWMMVRRI
jgi:hypothetical protein